MSLITLKVGGETKPVHFEKMKEREWILGDDTVDELYEYKNLGVLKNYIGSFLSNVENNIDKTWKKAEMIFPSNFDRRKVNPFTYIKFGAKHVCTSNCMALISLLSHDLQNPSIDTFLVIKVIISYDNFIAINPMKKNWGFKTEI